ncbi:MAG: hypothetical protein IPL19_03465 [Sandaracinaceae bacterium]|nr:hypothetical protein [Sandaracinaceae bacterium]
MRFLRPLVWLAVLVASLSARPGLALAQPLTWLLDPGVPADTRERIVGQTSDLPFVLLPPGAPGDPRGVEGDPLGRAARLALGTQARVVVWTTEREGGLEVTIVDLAARRVLVREVPASGPREHSAALETVGVIVRAALQALAEGGEIGVATPPVSQPPAPPAETAQEVVAAQQAEPAAAPRSESTRRSEVMLGAGLGLRFVVDDGPAFEGSGSLAWRYGRLWLGATVHASTRQRVRAAPAAISVAHAGAWLEAGVVAFERGAFALLPMGSLGVGRVRRETTRVADGFVGTGSRAHLDLRVGAGLRLRLALGPVAWLTLDARLELPFRRVLYTVNTDAGASTLARTPRAAPAFGLAVLARIGRVR